MENYSSNLDQTTRKAALRADPSQQDQAQERLAQLSITAATLKRITVTYQVYAWGEKGFGKVAITTDGDGVMMIQNWCMTPYNL